MHRRTVFIMFIALAALLIIVVGGVLYYAFGMESHRQPTKPSTQGQATQGQATVTATLSSGGKAYVGNGCGVKKNSNGTYTFSWLHVSSDGKVVDDTGCIVNLVGFNMAPLFLGDAVGSINPQKIDWYKQTFPMNLVRINFNSTWWDKDVFVPKANMHFRQWLEQNVQWQEQMGNYIELDNGPNYPEPPCGGTVTLCPSQNQGKKDYQTNPNPTTSLELETNIGPGVQAWTDIAKIYANDPAVLYDAWNEPTLKDLSMFFQDMNTYIDTIRAQNPRSLVIVYERGLKDIVAGKFPPYRQPNLVIDAHIYDGFNGTSPIDGKHCQIPGNANPVNSKLEQTVSFLHSQGQAFMVGEWGGCYDIPGYHQQLIAFAKANNLPLAYFAAGDVVTSAKSSTLELNENGRLVQAAYASIMGSTSG